MSETSISPTLLLLLLLLLLEVRLLEHLIVVWIAEGLLLQKILLLLHHPAKLLLWHATTELLLLLLLLRLLLEVVVVVTSAIAARGPFRCPLLIADFLTHPTRRGRQNIFVTCLIASVHCVLSGRVELVAHELIGTVPAGMGGRHVKTARMAVVPIIKPFVGILLVAVGVAVVATAVVVIVVVTVVTFVAVVAIASAASAAARSIAAVVVPILQGWSLSHLIAHLEVIRLGLHARRHLLLLLLCRQHLLLQADHAIFYLFQR